MADRREIEVTWQRRRRTAPVTWVRGSRQVAAAYVEAIGNLSIRQAQRRLAVRVNISEYADLSGAR